MRRDNRSFGPARYWLTLAGLLASLSPICGTQLAATPPVRENASDLSDKTEFESRLPSIDYKKIVLANGLTIILHTDHSDPLVHVNVTYNVGSSHDTIGKTGLAHFLEHLMSQGSKHVPRGDFSRLILEAGGRWNANTNKDRTSYYETVPSNHLEKILWLEADRMGFLADSITSESVEIQRKVILSERSRKIDNRTLAKPSDIYYSSVYPDNHPYAWENIGTVDDINGITKHDLRDFYRRWYKPNNATLLIGGDIDEVQTLKWIKKYFGPLSKGNIANDDNDGFVSPTKNQYVTVAGKIAAPRLFLLWPSVPKFHEDAAALHLLGITLARHSDSILFKKKIRSNLATRVNGGNFGRKRHGYFSLSLDASPKNRFVLPQLESAVRSVLEKFDEKAIDNETLEIEKLRVLNRKAYNLTLVKDKIEQLARYEFYAGNPGYLVDDINRYRRVTPNDLIRVFRKYVKNRAGVIISVIPEGESFAAAAEENRIKTKPDDNPSDNGISTPPIQAPIIDPFDRSQAPPVEDISRIEKLQTWKSKLSNGISIIGADNNETPFTYIEFRIPTGSKDDPVDKLGIAYLTGEILNRRSKASRKKLVQLGSSLRIGAQKKYTSLWLRAPSVHVDDALDVALYELWNPKFTEKEFQRSKTRAKSALEHIEKNQTHIADYAMSRLLLGNENPVAYSTKGTSKTISKIKLEDIEHRFSTYFSPQNAQLMVLSDLPKDQILQKLAPFSRWKHRLPPSGVDHRLPRPSKNNIYIIDRAGSKQSEVRVGRQAIAYDVTGKYFRASLMNEPLGRGVGSRLYRNLRDDKGYAYGVKSAFRGSKDSGYFVISTSVNATETATALAEIEMELRNYYSNGIEKDELTQLRSSFINRAALNNEHPNRKMRLLSQILDYCSGIDCLDRQRQIVSSITKKEIDRLIKEFLDFDEMSIVIVGDKAKIVPELQQMTGRKILVVE